MMYLITALISVAAGFCQTVVGFGGGILLMTVMPSYFNLQVAPTIVNGVTAPVSFSMWGRYHKHAPFSKIWLPALVYAIFSTVAIEIVGEIDLDILRVIFGVFLVALSVWFFFISDRVHIKPSVPAEILCTAFSGITVGLFGIGGPPLAMYFLAATDTKEEYLGEMNGVFSLTVIYQLVLRFIKGYVPEHFILILLAGFAGVALGRWFGTKLVDKINHSLFKKIIYVFLAVSGVMQIFGI